MKCLWHVARVFYGVSEILNFASCMIFSVYHEGERETQRSRTFARACRVFVVLYFCFVFYQNRIKKKKRGEDGERENDNDNMNLTTKNEACFQ